jgi:predicted adenylyl cyclase CyaB
MARNIEIKSSLRDPQVQLERAENLCGGDGERIHQVDVFFHCQHGRLKLRLFDDGHGELIHYHRPSESGPKLSDYVIVPLDDPESLREALTRAHGVRAIVEKERRLFIHGRTRIHLDRVSDLGAFLELEVVLAEDDDLPSGHREAEELMQQLRVDRAWLIDRAYVDLLEEHCR